MKNIFLLLLILLMPAGFVKAQCGIEEVNLPDSEKLEKANHSLKDKKYIKCLDKSQSKYLKKLPEKAEMIDVVTVTESACDRFKSETGLWVTLLSELQEVYQAKTCEFEQSENRLKKLIGLKDKNIYQCLVVLKISTDSLEVPKKSGGSGYPFTGLGFTCDWYYGDGCRYGLTEFTLKEKATNFTLYEINGVQIKDLLNKKLVSTTTK